MCPQGPSIGSRLRLTSVRRAPWSSVGHASGQMRVCLRHRQTVDSEQLTQKVGCKRRMMVIIFTQSHVIDHGGVSDICFCSECVSLVYPEVQGS
ncbi:hypothetical protein TNIN_85001 [Trichonephila inaurata madagascariensis]|uniref:Uncharacterized protein n=1 Tax=Trichonephila inaurata madagascariensis TaxID=2747483 RepID=A0A8X7BWK5_9ARAC|nr:hypothetical protein TNIN_85001 [Trichonephila inaurata madagascariensis]